MSTNYPELRILAETITEAVCAYRRAAHRLCQRLAEAHGIPVRALLWHRLTYGLMDDQWAWSFHGLQCRFENIDSKQIVEAELSFDEELGVIDPWFFELFVATTPRFRHLCGLFAFPGCDVWTVLEVLEKAGFLKRIESIQFPGRTGLLPVEIEGCVNP